jgi:hypothetical protein
MTLYQDSRNKNKNSKADFLPVVLEVTRNTGRRELKFWLSFDFYPSRALDCPRQVVLPAFCGGGDSKLTASVQVSHFLKLTAFILENMGEPFRIPRKPRFHR